MPRHRPALSHPECATWGTLGSMRCHLAPSSGASEWLESAAGSAVAHATVARVVRVCAQRMALLQPLGQRQPPTLRFDIVAT